MRPASQTYDEAVGTPTSPRPPSVGQNLNQLAIGLHDLEQAVESLLDRLTPREHPPEAKQGSEIKQSYLIHISTDACQTLARIQVQIDQVHSLLEFQ